MPTSLFYLQLSLEKREVRTVSLHIILLYIYTSLCAGKGVHMFFCLCILYSPWCYLWSFKSRYVFPLIFLHRLKRLVRFYTFTTPPGLTLGYQSLLPPSLTSCSRCESRVVWIRTRDQWWCTAALASDALGHFVLWTPASYWFVQSSATEKS